MVKEKFGAQHFPYIILETKEVSADSFIKGQTIIARLGGNRTVCICEVIAEKNGFYTLLVLSGPVRKGKKYNRVSANVMLPLLKDIGDTVFIQKRYEKVKAKIVAVRPKFYKNNISYIVQTEEEEKIEFNIFFDS